MSPATELRGQSDDMYIPTEDFRLRRSEASTKHRESTMFIKVFVIRNEMPTSGETVRVARSQTFGSSDQLNLNVGGLQAYLSPNAKGLKAPRKIQPSPPNFCGYNRIYTG
uniref:Uncharacterized protein n=1 Tax=Oryza barthii TaxID=65489 RepID=A0A0D3FDX5_9ORYZ